MDIQEHQCIEALFFHGAPEVNVHSIYDDKIIDTKLYKFSCKMYNIRPSYYWIGENYEAHLFGEKKSVALVRFMVCAGYPL